MKKKKGLKIWKILDIIMLIIFAILTIFLIVNILKLSNIENLIRGVVIVILILLLGLFTFFCVKNKKMLLWRIIIILLCCGYGFINYTFHKLYSSLNNIEIKEETKTIYLVSAIDEVKNIKDITNDEIAILTSAKNEEFYDLAEETLTEKELENKLIEYEEYSEIINDLLSNKIKYAFLPQNYEDIYNNDKEEITKLEFNILHTATKTTKIETVVETKSLTEPFTLLLIGTDAILNSYNADTLMLMTVNPKTLKVTMLSIPRDTYTTISCSNSKHKINSSGWNGDKCVVKTIEKYLNIKIDYYAKINFLGVVELVDKLGGIDVNVPYALCEQNSERQFGEKTVYIDAGQQTLNGEQALALSRNRHYWKDFCPAKYTTDGNRSDLTRGQNQQLVIKAILNKIMTIRNVSTFYGILDSISNNMSTNMSKDTILSFYNVGKDIVKKLNSKSTDEIINVEKLYFKSYFASILIGGMELSTIVNYNESVEYVSTQMKKNLGLIKEEPIKTFSFDVNEPYNQGEVKFNKLSSNLKLLPNFVGKTLNEAMNYCDQNGIKCETTETNLNKTIISQSIGKNTDISTLGNKTIIFESDSPSEPNIDKELEKDKDKINDSTKEETEDKNEEIENDKNDELNKDEENKEESTSENQEPETTPENDKDTTKKEEDENNKVEEEEKQDEQKEETN